MFWTCSEQGIEFSLNIPAEEQAVLRNLLGQQKDCVIAYKYYGISSKKEPLIAQLEKVFWFCFVMMISPLSVFIAGL